MQEWWIECITKSRHAAFVFITWSTMHICILRGDTLKEFQSTAFLSWRMSPNWHPTCLCYTKNRLQISPQCSISSLPLTRALMRPPVKTDLSLVWHKCPKIDLRSPCLKEPLAKSYTPYYLLIATNFNISTSSIIDWAVLYPKHCRPFISGLHYDILQAQKRT